MGVAAGSGQYCLGDTVPGSLSHRHDRAVCIDPVVEVLTYVLQAGRRTRKASVEGQRFSPELADVDPRRPRTAKKTFHGAVAQRSDAYGAWHQARSTTSLLEDSPQVPWKRIKEPESCLRSST